jgi:type I restriction enzyme S subunit
MKWRRRPIHELCSEIVDCVNKTAPTVAGPTPWRMIRTTNVRNGRVNLERVRYVERPVYDKWVRRGVPVEGDIILTREAPLGEVAKLRDASGVFLGQRLVMYRPDLREVDGDFLLAAMQGPVLQAQMRALGSGSTVEHLRVGDCQELMVDCPPLPNQRLIGAFLTSFEDLIEINEQRVGRLEAVVRSYFRRKVDGAVRLERTTHGTSEHGGLPKGWKRCSLGDVARLTYGRSLPKPRRRPGHVAVVSSAGVIDTHDTALQPGPGLVLGRKGNVGSVWWVEDAFHPIDTTYYVQSDLPLGFLYWSLQGAAFVDSHAAVPGLSRDQALAVDIVLPPEAIVTEVAELHRNAFRVIAAYRKVNDAAKMMRDLLLPRLVSGQLDISDIDLGILTPTESE